MDWTRSARNRFEWHRRGGLTPADALDAVAVEYGLAQRVVRLTGKSPDELVPMHWTLDEMDDLLALKWATDAGVIGGPEH